MTNRGYGIEGLLEDLCTFKPLTKLELKRAKLLASGYTIAEIAGKEFLKPKYLNEQFRRMRLKQGYSTNFQLVHELTKEGLI